MADAAIPDGSRNREVYVVIVGAGMLELLQSLPLLCMRLRASLAAC
jgi:hypothetical protein